MYTYNITLYYITLYYIYIYIHIYQRTVRISKACNDSTLERTVLPTKHVVRFWASFYFNEIIRNSIGINTTAYGQAYSMLWHAITAQSDPSTSRSYTLPDKNLRNYDQKTQVLDWVVQTPRITRDPSHRIRSLAIGATTKTTPLNPAAAARTPHLRVIPATRTTYILGSRYEYKSQPTPRS